MSATPDTNVSSNARPLADTIATAQARAREAGRLAAGILRDAVRLY